MAERLSRKLAVILHADVVGSTALVQRDEALAHERIQDAFRRFSETIETYGGATHELRGDALVAEFDRASDAVSAAITFQAENSEFNATLHDAIRPQVRIGISLGEVVIADNTITGAGVVLAQRLEQRAEPGGVFLQGAVYEAVPRRLPFSYESLGEQTVKGFEEPVRVYTVTLKAGEVIPPPDSVPRAEKPASELPDKPSIAVLPFTNMSGDPDQEYFADGLTEDIITALAKNRWMLVIARNAVFSFKGRPVDLRHIAKELVADYIVEGSVRKVSNRVRISAQLIDAASGTHIWAERYDRDLGDFFAVEDEITGTIAATIEPELGSIEQQRAQQKSPKNLDAWDCYHLGLFHMYRFNKQDNAEARRHLHRAIELDPGFAAAYARLAYCIVVNMVYFNAEPAPKDLDEALDIANTAVSLDGRDAVAHFALGRVYLVKRDYELSLAEYETSVALNPHLAQAHCGLGDALAYAGRLDESIQHFEKAIRLSPHDPYKWGFMNFRSMAHLFLKQYEEAAKWAREATRVPVSQYWAKAGLVAALGYLDRPEETRAALDDLLREKPDFSCSFAKHHLFYIKSINQLECYLNGLRKAGLPE